MEPRWNLFRGSTCLNPFVHRRSRLQRWNVEPFTYFPLFDRFLAYFLLPSCLSLEGHALIARAPCAYFSRVTCLLLEGHVLTSRTQREYFSCLSAPFCPKFSKSSPVIKKFLLFLSFISNHLSIFAARVCRIPMLTP